MAAVSSIATVTSFSSASIMWTVPSVTYTPETYAVVYGTDQMSLNQKSVIIHGVSDTTHYIIELTQLEHNTSYYYKIQSNNTVGSTESGTYTFDVLDAGN